MPLRPPWFVIKEGADWADPVHDAAGNMTTMPSPASPADPLTCIYDALNRLVEVKDGAATAGAYEFDGLGRRISETAGMDWGQAGSRY